MIAFVSDACRWSRDETGAWLCVKCDRAPAIAEEASGKRMTFTIKEYRKKRSLDANAFYWATLGQLATALEVSTPYLHNMMLRRYGQTESYDGQLVYVVLPDTDDAEKKAAEAETYHLKPTSNTRQGKDGNTYRTYIMLRGSSTYDSAEMARLIDGLLDECRNAGVTVVGREWI